MESSSGRSRKEDRKMAVKNSLQATAKRQSRFPEIIKSEAVQKNLMGTLGDATRTKRFTASVISAVSTNPALQECQATTIISAALLGESLNLSPSPQLGHYYMVPFKDNKAGVTNATFQLGYKGYIQLAIRSGQYKKLNVLAIKEGELIKYDPLDETLEVKLIENEAIREKTPTIGYYAMFELVNGFRKTMYWSKGKMEEHAEKYSLYCETCKMNICLRCENSHNNHQTISYGKMLIDEKQFKSYMALYKEMNKLQIDIIKGIANNLIQ